MSESTNYYKIGVFVAMGLTLLVVTLILLSTIKLFNRPLYFESYFDESVEGLSVGSAVKFRGVQVGTVNQISFVGVIYKDQGINGMDDPYAQYIYVKMGLRLPFVHGGSAVHSKKDLQHAIARGLRIRLMPQGLTGNSYLELDYVNPRLNPQIQINWEPENFYIPFATSTYTQFVELLSDIHRANVPKLVKDFDKTINHLNDALIRGHYGDLGAKMQMTVDLLNKTLNMMNLIFSNQQTAIQDSIGNLENTTQNLRNFSETASENPSQILLGSPPPQIRKNP